MYGNLCIYLVYNCDIVFRPNDREMCTRFAELERKLGEIDRARVLYMHASQMADPRVIIQDIYNLERRGKINLQFALF